MRGAYSDQGSVRSWTVATGETPLRLDAFVRRCLPHLSMREVRRAIDAGEFFLEGRPGRKGKRLSGGEVVSFRGSPHLLAPAPLPRSELNVQILYEDEQILVVDKPAGMATHGFSGKATDTLANFLAAIRPSVARVGKNRWEPGLVHRLDRDTSGIVLIAKEQNAFENLRSQFRRRLVRKRYLALVRGTTEGAGVIAYPLIHDRRDRRKMTVLVEQKGGGSAARQWQAVTRFRTVGQSKNLSLLVVEMETGVTHQIRAHLSAIGHPIAGDPLYGGDHRDSCGLRRQFLHASYLGFRHPGSGKEGDFECPLPQELQEVLERLAIKL